MKLVAKTKHGEFKWNEVTEVESVEAFINNRNEKLSALFGKPVIGYSLVGNNMIKHVDTTGKLIETFYLCETHPYRLL